MTLCRKCGKEIPDGEELCQECQTIEDNLSDDYLDELMQSMENELNELGVEEPVAEKPNAEEEEPLPELEMPEEEPLPELETPEEEEPLPELEMPEEEPLPELETPEEEPLPEPEAPEEGEKPVRISVGSQPEEEEDEPPLESGEEPPVEEEKEEKEEKEETEEKQENEETEEKEEDIDALLSMLSQDYEDREEEVQETEPLEEIETHPADESPMEAALFSDDDEGEIFADGPGSVSVDDIFEDALSAVDYSGAEQEDEPEEVLEEFISPEEAEQPQEDDSFNDLALDETFALDDSGVSDMDAGTEVRPIAKPLAKKAKKAKNKKNTDSVWKRVFGNIITEQTAEEERKEREAEQATAEERAEAKKEKKKQLAAEKAEKAEQAKAEKERKAAEKAEKAAVKEAEKAEKKRLKIEAAANEVVGKINPVGASIVMVFFGLVCVGSIFGSQLLSRFSSLKGAGSSFDAGDYKEAYEQMAGVEVSEGSDSFEMKDKIRICMQLQRQMDAFGNYYKMKMYLEALDSLMKGIRSYDENHSKAERYNIISQYNELEVKLAEQLYQEFGVSESQARNINSIEDQAEYTSRLQNIIQQWEQRSKEDER